MLLGDVGAQAFESLDVQIDGPRADGAAAGEGNAAWPQRATSGPSTSVEARMVLTNSYEASGSSSVAQWMVVRCCARP